MTTLRSQAQAREQAEEVERLKKRAARQAAKNIGQAKPEETVKAVVLPKGDGKISMGVHIPSVGEAYYEEGEEITVAKSIAIELYDRGYINFDGARPLLNERNKRRQERERRALELMDPEEREAVLPGASA